jgi:hypothetical protein
MEPQPAQVHEQLPESDLGRCTTPACRLGWLWYQRQDSERGYPRHFFFCRRCGQRYAAWEAGWTPGAAKSPEKN